MGRAVCSTLVGQIMNITVWGQLSYIIILEQKGNTVSYYGTGHM